VQGKKKKGTNHSKQRVRESKQSRGGGRGHGSRRGRRSKKTPENNRKEAGNSASTNCQLMGVGHRFRKPCGRHPPDKNTSPPRPRTRSNGSQWGGRRGARVEGHPCDCNGKAGFGGKAPKRTRLITCLNCSEKKTKPAHSTKRQ